MTTTLPQGVVPSWTINDRLRKAREYSGLDQALLADAIEVSRATISNYETGSVNPRKIVVRQWALRCGVSFEWLWSGQEGATSPDGPDRWAPRGSNPQPTDYKFAVSDLAADELAARRGLRQRVVPLRRPVVVPLGAAA